MVKRSATQKGIHFEANMISSWSFVRSIIDSASKQKKQTVALKSMDTDPSLMNTAQLSLVANKSMEWLKVFCENQAAGNEHDIITRAEATMYAKYLLVCMLSNHPSQRSEIFRLLEPEKTMFLVSQEGASGIPPVQVWEIRIPPAQTKSNKPVIMQFTAQISRFIDVYNNAIRPMVFSTLASQSNLLFPDRNGNPRSDFSSWTRQVTQEIIGIPINAHAFRHAQITSLYNDPNTTTASLEFMANSMGHTVETQKTFYRSIQHRRQSASSTTLLQDLYRKAAGVEQSQQQPQSQLYHQVQYQQPQQHHQVQYHQPNNQQQQQAHHQQQQGVPSHQLIVQHQIVPQQAVQSAEQLQPASPASIAVPIAVPVARVSPPHHQQHTSSVLEEVDDNDIVDLTDTVPTKPHPHRWLFQQAVIQSTAPFGPSHSYKRSRHEAADVSSSYHSTSDVADPWADEFGPIQSMRKRQRKQRRPTVVQRWTGTQLQSLRSAMQVYGNQWSSIMQDTTLMEQLGKRTAAQIRSKAFHLNQMEAQRNVATSSKDPAPVTLMHDEEADVSYDDEAEILFDDEQ